MTKSSSASSGPSRHGDEIVDRLGQEDAALPAVDGLEAGRADEPRVLPAREAAQDDLEGLLADPGGPRRDGRTCEDVDRDVVEEAVLRFDHVERRPALRRRRKERGRPTHSYRDGRYFFRPFNHSLYLADLTKSA